MCGIKLSEFLKEKQPFVELFNFDFPTVYHKVLFTLTILEALLTTKFSVQI